MLGNLLLNELVYQDIPVDEAADALGLRPDQFLARLFGKVEFRLEEIQRMKELLALTDEEVDTLFFG